MNAPPLFQHRNHELHRFSLERLIVQTNIQSVPKICILTRLIFCIIMCIYFLGHPVYIIYLIKIKRYLSLLVVCLTRYKKEYFPTLCSVSICAKGTLVLTKLQCNGTDLWRPVAFSSVAVENSYLHMTTQHRNS
jgi:hypothetical protein